jgi:hypothetical protein
MINHMIQWRPVNLVTLMLNSNHKLWTVDDVLGTERVERVIRHV